MCVRSSPNVTEVRVMPQPYGTAYSQMLTPNGEINVHHTYMRTGIVDVGTYTVDIALDDDGEFDSSTRHLAPHRKKSQTLVFINRVLDNALQNL